MFQALTGKSSLKRESSRQFFLRKRRDHCWLVTQNSFSGQFYEQAMADTSRAGLIESENIQIGPAKPGDIDVVLGILNQATSWLLDNKLPTPWVPGKFSRQTFQEQISKCEVYLATANTVPVGTLVLQWSDPTYWGEKPSDSGYLHKFAVKPEHYGKGIGQAMLRYAMERARQAGKKYLRLNCVAEDKGIRDYYENSGFEYRGNIIGPVCLASLYELAL